MTSDLSGELWAKEEDSHNHTSFDARELYLSVVESDPANRDVE